MVQKSNLIASIIIRGKNESKWLKILLPELQKQSVRNFEIIFCDNNSEDNTLDILKKYKIKKILKFKKYLPGKVLNSAIKKAKGKYICILSAHCIPVNKNWLKEHIDFINKDKNYAAVFGKQIPLPGSSFQNLIDLDIIFKEQEIIYKKDPYLNNANSIYRANILKKNLFDSRLTNIEDREWANKITKKGYKISYSARSEVYHLHGIHQHAHKSSRSQSTYNILIKKYLNKWKKCTFLKTNNLRFCLIINARREHNFSKFNNKISRLLKKIKVENSFIKKIIIISNFKTNKIKALDSVKSKNSLKEDLKFIYKKFRKDWIKNNYIVYINISKKFDFKNLKNLIDDSVYYNRESAAFDEKVNENFIINYRGEETFKSTDLGKIEHKPIITLIKLSKGAIAEIDYLRRGLLITNNTFINTYE